MQRSRYTHTAKQVFPYSQESTTGSLHKCTTPHIIDREIIPITYSTPNLDNMSLYELMFGHRATISQELDIRSNVVVSRMFTDYYERLRKNLKYMRDRLQKFRSERTDLMNKNKGYHAYEVGQIVYMY